MKIFTGKQIHDLDAFTIEHEPISSNRLMERAADALTVAITARWDHHTPVIVFAGPGNNGGDALGVALRMAEQQYDVAVYLFNTKDNLSDGCRYMREQLKGSRRLKQFTEVTQEFNPPELTADTLVIDGLFGSGLNKPLSGGFAAVVKYINMSPCKVVSIDLPSGLMTEDNSYNIHQNIIRANVTLTLHMKKLCMLLADCQQYLGDVEVLDIKLSEEWIRLNSTPFCMAEKRDVIRLLRSRSDFAHKGSMGHALLIAGSFGMSGAAILATKACLRSGVGKATVHTPMRNYDIMQISVPEAIVSIDKDERCFSEAVDDNGCQAILIGPGIGQREATAIALISQIRRSQKLPIVIDADGLNILGARRAWLQQLPQGLILTPHPKEYDRLEGNDSQNDYERLSKAREMAQRLQGYIILKGHFSALCQPDGSVIFNTTGNGGMATAGAGDVLSGIITGFLARGYTQAEASLLGMYIHGLAGDIAMRRVGRESLIASDIIEALPQAFLELQNER